MRSRSWVLVVLVAMALCSPSPTADACGGFFAKRSLKQVTVPSLQVEQVLILHDPDTEQEHFIRELVFRDADEPFGFIVPTPSLPTVAKVATPPFSKLSRLYPPEEMLALSGIGLGGFGRGSGGGGRPAVAVLSEQRVGSFTAFVLAANDAGALKKWLDDNALVSTPKSDAWLAHYVQSGFFFVAFRYERPAGKPSLGMKSETVRISFSTPLPYYPYKEPEHEQIPEDRRRVLTVWLASHERHVPVALRERGAARGWQRPWLEALTHPSALRRPLTEILGAELGGLLPAGRQEPLPVADNLEAKAEVNGDDRWLVVQTFEDQKFDRGGWGDVVLVPESPRHGVTDAWLQRAQKLMAVLEPSLEKAP